MKNLSFLRRLVCVALFLSVFAPTAYAQTYYQPVRFIDSSFGFTYGVAVDGIGNLYVVDAGKSNVQKFDSNGKLLLKFGTPGSGNGQFKNPQSLAVDNSGNIYVADSKNFRVEKFDSSGAFLMGIGAGYNGVAGAIGTKGTGNGQFGGPNTSNIGPTNVAVDRNGNIYVADPAYNRLQKFDKNGSFLLGIGSGYNGVKGSIGASGNGNGQFLSPQGVAVDSNGNVYTIEYQNNRVQKFDANGNYLLQFAESGLNAIAVDSQDRVWLSITMGEVIVNDTSGNFMFFIGPDANHYWSAADHHGSIAIDDSGNLFELTLGTPVREFSPTIASVSGTFTFKGKGASAPQYVGCDFRSNDGTLNSGIVLSQFFDANGAYTINLPASVSVLHIKPVGYLTVNLAVDLSNGNLTGQNITFEPGDIDNDNYVGPTDFGLFVSAYNSDASVPGSGYDATCDLNGDGLVDDADFGLFVGSYNKQGDP